MLAPPRIQAVGIHYDERVAPKVTPEAVEQSRLRAENAPLKREVEI
ncbi:hypothetical protein [uncultured Thiocystis sp.]|nr:hypothetical protein [uncultured Thiocystis sp.]